MPFSLRRKPTFAVAHLRHLAQWEPPTRSYEEQPITAIFDLIQGDRLIDEQGITNCQEVMFFAIAEMVEREKTMALIALDNADGSAELFLMKPVGWSGYALVNGVYQLGESKWEYRFIPWSKRKDGSNFLRYPHKFTSWVWGRNIHLPVKHIATRDKPVYTTAGQKYTLKIDLASDNYLQYGHYVWVEGNKLVANKVPVEYDLRIQGALKPSIMTTLEQDWNGGVTSVDEVMRLKEVILNYENFEYAYYYPAGKPKTSSPHKNQHAPTEGSDHTKYDEDFPLLPEQDPAMPPPVIEAGVNESASTVKTCQSPVQLSYRAKTPESSRDCPYGATESARQQSRIDGPSLSQSHTQNDLEFVFASCADQSRIEEDKRPMAASNDHSGCTERLGQLEGKISDLQHQIARLLDLMSALPQQAASNGAPHEGDNKSAVVSSARSKTSRQVSSRSKKVDFDIHNIGTVRNMLAENPVPVPKIRCATQNPYAHNPHHRQMAAVRFDAIPFVLNLSRRTSKVCFIGGDPQREFIPGTTSVYINPVLDDQDIKRYQRAQGQQVIQDRIENVSREEITRDPNCSVLFVLLNSAYYVGSRLLDLVQEGDYIVLAQHTFTQRMTFSDCPTLAMASSELSVNNQHVTMCMKGDTQRFEHSSRSLLDYALVDMGDLQVSLIEMVPQHENGSLALAYYEVLPGTQRDRKNKYTVVPNQLEVHHQHYIQYKGYTICNARLSDHVLLDGKQEPIFFTWQEIMAASSYQDKVNGRHKICSTIIEDFGVRDRPDFLKLHPAMQSAGQIISKAVLRRKELADNFLVPQSLHVRYKGKFRTIKPKILAPRSEVFCLYVQLSLARDDRDVLEACTAFNDIISSAVGINQDRIDSANKILFSVIDVDQILFYEATNQWTGGLGVKSTVAQQLVDRKIIETSLLSFRMVLTRPQWSYLGYWRGITIQDDIRHTGIIQQATPIYHDRLEVATPNNGTQSDPVATVVAEPRLQNPVPPSKPDNVSATVIDHYAANDSNDDSDDDQMNNTEEEVRPARVIRHKRAPIPRDDSDGRGRSNTRAKNPNDNQKRGKSGNAKQQKRSQSKKRSLSKKKRNEGKVNFGRVRGLTRMTPQEQIECDFAHMALADYSTTCDRQLQVAKTVLTRRLCIDVRSKFLRPQYYQPSEYHAGIARSLDRDVFVTNNPKMFEQWCVDHLQPNQVVYVDLEASPEFNAQLISAIIIVQGDHAAIGYGYESSTMSAMYCILAHDNCLTNAVWDSNLESCIIPNIVDLQRNPAFNNGQSRKLGLYGAAKRLSLTYWDLKVDYSQYLNPRLEQLHIDYALQDCTLLQAIVQRLELTELKYEYDIVQCGNLTIQHTSTDPPPAKNQLMYCRAPNPQQQQMLPVAAALALLREDVARAYDVGSGNSGTECALAALFHCLAPVSKHAQGYSTRRDLDAIGRQIDFASLQVLEEGTSVNSLISFININCLPINVVTTDLPQGYYMSRPVARHYDHAILIHHGHAWFVGKPGLPIKVRRSPSSGQAGEPVDCHCGACVPLPKRHNSLKCPICANQGIKDSDGDFNSTKAARAWVNRQTKQLFVAPKYASRAHAIDIVPPSLNAERKKFETGSIRVGDQGEQRLSRMVSWKDGRVAITSRCVGDINIALNHDQAFQRTDTPLDAKRCGACAQYQIGPIIDGLPYETYNNCPHNELYAQAQRQTKSKAVPNKDVIRAFVRYAKQFIDNTYHEALGVPDPEDASNYEIAAEYVQQRGLNKSTRDTYLTALLEAWRKPRKIITSSDGFIKRELTFGLGWPRLISARDHVLRNLSCIPYKFLEQQVYDNDCFIKKKDQDEQVRHIIDKISHFPVVACMDLSSYDSAQRGAIWEIEQHLVRTITPRWADTWCAITQNASLIKGQYYTSTQTCCRNSGEMTTSLTNTLICYLLFRFAAHTFGMTWGQDVDGCFEGDDSILGAYDQQFVINCSELISQVGFDVTFDHIGGVTGASFCKIIFDMTPSGVVGYKRLDHSLAKFGWCDQPLSLKKSSEMLRAKLCSLVAMYEGWDKMVELATTIDPEYHRVTKKISDFFTSPRMTATQSYMNEHYGQMMDALIHAIRQRGRYAIVAQTELGRELNMDPANKQLDYVFYDFSQNQPADYGYVGKAKVEASWAGWRRDNFQDFQEKSADMNNPILVAIDEFDQEVKNKNAMAPTKSIKIKDIDDNAGNSMQVPIYVLKDVAELKSLDAAFGPLAEKGILAHINSDFYSELKNRVGKQQARMKIKQLTSHNGKLGFNWSVVLSQYVAAAPNIRQFETSGYKQLIPNAVRYYRIINPAYSAYLQSRLANFNYPVVVNQQPVMQVGEIPGYGAGEDRQVKGLMSLNRDLQERIEQLEAALFEHSAERKNSDRDEMTRRLSRIRKIMQGFAKTMKRAVDDDVYKYLMAVYKPFHPAAVSARIPMTIPVLTSTITIAEDLQFSTRINTLIVGNFNAWRTGSLAVLAGTDTELSFDNTVQSASLQQQEFINTSSLSTALYYPMISTNANYAAVKKYQTSGGAFMGIGTHGGVRLVGASVRLIKTSRNLSESGIARMTYSPGVRALPSTGSIDRLFEGIGKYSNRTYLATGDAEVLAQIDYRPQASGLQDFRPFQSLFLDPWHDNSFRRRPTSTDVQPGSLDESMKLQYTGPISYFRKVAGVTQYVLDTSTLGSTGATDIGINAEDIQAPGSFMIALTGGQDTTTCELRIVRHYEMVSDDSYVLGDRKECPLPIEYSNTEEVLRRAHLEYPDCQFAVSDSPIQVAQRLIDEQTIKPSVLVEQAIESVEKALLAPEGSY